jgi:hypothetical protein
MTGNEKGPGTEISTGAGTGTGKNLAEELEKEQGN